MTFKILHVSDVHFGMTDNLGEQPGITASLISSAHEYVRDVDLCIFSGDLSQKGDIPDLNTRGDWLRRLAAKWECPIFVVPGNHDVVRGHMDGDVKSAYETLDKYSEVRKKLSLGPYHLANFKKWHAEFAAGGDVISDWSDPFGCSTTIEGGAVPIRIVGLNTALLSKDNDDKSRLVLDAISMNELLRARGPEECVIAVGYHPLNWLTDWNGEYVTRLLAQEVGANLYLHGHQHETSTTTVVSMHAGLTTLECGAAYGGSD